MTTYLGTWLFSPWKFFVIISSFKFSFLRAVGVSTQKHASLRQELSNQVFHFIGENGAAYTPVFTVSFFIASKPESVYYSSH